MLEAWSRHLVKDPEAKKKFEDMVRGSKLLTDRLQEIIQTLEDNLQRTEISPDAFQDSNWAYKQAYYNGQKAMLQRLRIITDVNPTKETMTNV